MAFETFKVVRVVERTNKLPTDDFITRMANLSFFTFMRSMWWFQKTLSRSR